MIHVEVGMMLLSLSTRHARLAIRDIAMPPNKSNDIINSFFTLPHTCSAVRFLDIYLSSLPYQKKKQKFQTPYFLNLFTTAGETASSMYSAILNGVVGVHIDKREFSRDQRYLD